MQPAIIIVKKKHPKALIVLRLHPLNFPLILIGSFFFNIVYWKSEKIPESWLKRFEVIDPEDYFTYEEWIEVTAQAQKSWKIKIEPWNDKTSFLWKQINITVDFSNTWLQWLGIYFEEYFFFLHLSKRWIEKAISIKAVKFADLMIFDLASDLKYIVSASSLSIIKIFYYLDLAWQWSLALIFCFRQLGRLIQRRDKSVNTRETYRYLWTGISPQEAASEPNQLDFAFLVERGIINSKDCLFILAKQPSNTTISYLSKRNIHWTTTQDIGKWLNIRERVLALLGLFKTLLHGCFLRKKQIHTPLILQFCFNTQSWIFFIKKIKPEIYFSTVSESWPERPEVSVINALGVNTVNWFYSANIFSYSQTNPAFEDLGILRSISVAREIWVWNETVAQWFNLRNIQPKPDQPKIKVTGPIMCGNSQWLKKTPADVRSSYGIKSEKTTKFIAVFDVPTITRAYRIKIGHGPSLYPLKMLEQFFDDLCNLLDAFENVNLIIKPKRSLEDPQRDYSKGMWRLINPTGHYQERKKITLLPHNIDPYLPIAMSDFCVGLPFTSPVLVGLSSGRDGLFHDPLSCVNYFYPKEITPLITHGKKEFLERIDQWMKGNKIKIRNQSVAEAYCGSSVDPAIQFATLALSNPSN